mmetsp:Transcript_21223/g.15234  ORF Transcript_21223/g.15234 Transcript_21223/m.15234 type:complete len:130 (+) Transcript_21223:456-845(+)
MEQQEAIEKGLFCKHCELVKPLKTHHCSVCGTCVLRMDHHCPWLHNCIGLNNYRFFVQMIFHTSFSDFFTLYCAFQARNTHLWQLIIGGPYLLIYFHLVHGVAFMCYTIFHLYCIDQDFTTFDLLFDSK